MWINQPSTLQADHKYNGRLVLANPKKDELVTDVYFADGGNVAGCRMFTLSLSEGWPDYYKEKHFRSPS